MPQSRREQQRHSRRLQTCWRVLPCLVARRRTEYVLPDGIHDTWGHVLGEQPGELDGSGGQQQQGGGGSGPGGGAAGANGAAGGPKGGARQTLLVVNNERFMTPEVRQLCISRGWLNAS